MPLLAIRRLMVCAALLLGSQTMAQPATNDAVLFIWNDVVMAQSIAGNELIEGQFLSSEERRLLPTSGINVYSIEQSPLQEPSTDGYGFHQGLWSPDRTTFVYLAIEPDGPGYRLVFVDEGQQHSVLSDRVDNERGYLTPLGWTSAGELILLERYLLHNLHEARLWRYDPASESLAYVETIATPELHGNSAALTDGWVFVGFDTINLLGFLLNANTLQLINFPTSFALLHPPASVFELYPVDIIGIANLEEVRPWLAQRPAEAADPPAANDLSPPFLYWPLPDHARSITCYPDSEWTLANFAVVCPGLAEPRAYQGHEGTDIGGKPNGLTSGTQVYAAARGIVVKTLSTCISDDITCGDAYGNYLLIEHTRVIAGNTETWFTGYAHLQTVLVEPYRYVDEIGAPIAVSGDTGLGGPHLHFEVRSPEQAQASNWIDAWDNRASLDGVSLWVGGNAHPVSAVDVSAPPAQILCQTVADNNMRSGPGMAYEVMGKTTAQTSYAVFQVQFVGTGQAPGDWYHVRWDDSGITGWIWSGLMTDCAAVTEPTDP